MADFSDSKAAVGAQYQVGSYDGQEISRVEPLITCTQLRNRQLFGIPLYSFIPDPISGIRAELTDDLLSDLIMRAVSEAELETGITLFPTCYTNKQPFDNQWWYNFSYTRVVHRPIMSVEKFAFTLANGGDIFVVNPDWIEPANFSKGQINLVPLIPAVGGSHVAANGTVANGGAFLTFLGGMSFVPALIRIDYTAGFPNGMMPRIVNELIGIIAALEALSLLAATNRASSYSMNIDGIGQSVSVPLLYVQRMEFLLASKKSITNKLKNLYGLGVFTDWV